MKPVESLTPAYFDHVYAARADPWGFETSAYEHAKYAATVAALPCSHYRSALEVGCSIGVLTALLAPRCEALLALDISDAALASARSRLALLPQVALQKRKLPQEFPPGLFDLIVLSEVGYYWSRADLHRAGERIVAALVEGATLMLVHWTPVVPDYPLTGDEVHMHFMALCSVNGPLRHVTAQAGDTYRLDVFERTASAPLLECGSLA